MSKSESDLIYYGGDLNYPPLKGNIGQFILECMDKHQQRIVQIDAINEIYQTYAELRQLSIRCALEMKARGVKKGDVITICGRSHLNLILPWLGAIYLGAITNALHPEYSHSEIHRMLHITKPKMIFSDDECFHTIERMKNELKLNSELINFRKSFTPFIATHHNVDKFQVENVNPDEDNLFIVCTSGTTGLIKGTTATHTAFYISITESQYLMEPDDRFILYSPLSWVTNPMTYGISWIRGACKVVAEYEPNLNIEIILKYKVTWMLMTPLKLTEMVQNPLLKKYPNVCDSIRLIMYGGSPSTKEQIEDYHRTFPKSLLWNGYGSSEMIGPHTYFDIKNDIELFKKKKFSHGKPAPGVYWKVIDPETGRIVGRNEKGELFVKGPSLTKGYYKDPEATSKAIDKDGWFHTGDMVTIDEDDCIYVVGRYKELLKYKGWQVPPGEIEEVIRTHPAIEHVCVMGRPHPTDGDLPVAIVKIADGATLSENDLIEYVNPKVSDVQKLRGGVIFVKNLPVTTSGKIHKAELRKLINVA